jgi:RNA polymerase sigma factor (sigma-70 family)
MEIAISMGRLADETGERGEAGSLAAARRGEPAALSQLYRRHAATAYSLALRITGHPDRAEDVVQDAFLRAFEGLGGFRGDAPFGAWLRRVVVNMAIDRLRAERRLLSDPDRIDALTADSVGFDRPLDTLGLLARLAPAARTVLVLHDLEGYSHAEIAHACGHSESWSKSVLSRARARLQSWLTEDAHD